MSNLDEIMAQLDIDLADAAESLKEAQQLQKFMVASGKPDRQLDRNIRDAEKELDQMTQARKDMIAQA